MVPSTTPPLSGNVIQNDDLLPLSPPPSKPLSYDASTISTFESEEYERLREILSSPEQLVHFQSYLQSIHAHENLLFIEALSELRHEKSSKSIESTIQRIWKTFLTTDAPLEINVSKKEEIDDFIQSHKWAILSNCQALDIFSGAEIEVKMFLNEKIAEFDKIYKPSKINLHESTTCNPYQKRVVIIGGGFTGFTVASILDPMPRFHVTLIDTKDSFEYTPGMIKLLVRPEETSSLRVRHNAYVKNGRVIIGYAEKILEDAKSLEVNNEYIPLDYLVIATGSTYQSKLKSFDTSSLYRLSDLSLEHNDLKQAKSILIIGGGLVGCELASEIATHHKDKQISLIESNSHLVQRSSAKRQSSAYNYLSSLGVKIVLNENIIDFDSLDSNSYLGSSGATYSGFDKVFLATGTTPCSDILQGDGDVGFESCVDYWGRLRVKPTLQLDHWKYKHIFAGGDVTNVVEEKTGYAATLAGVCIARNICRIEKKKEPLYQGTKGTLPAPLTPLHGIESLGGIGRQHLSGWKKTFSFLNPSWAALKYFDEKEFLNIVQGEAKLTTHSAIGKKPKVLDLPSGSSLSTTSVDADSCCCCCCGKSIYSSMNNSIFSASASKQTNRNGNSEFLLPISSTNLSGSDIININEARKCSCDLLACELSHPSSTTEQQSPSLNISFMDDNWLNNSELKPRPSTLSTAASTPNLRQQQTIHRRRTINNYFAVPATAAISEEENYKRLYHPHHHRKNNSQ